MTLLDEAVELTKAAAHSGAPADLPAAVVHGHRDPNCECGWIARVVPLQGRVGVE
jgi:hypothetical protein